MLSGVIGCAACMAVKERRLVIIGTTLPVERRRPALVRAEPKQWVRAERNIQSLRGAPVALIS